jgi:hypothetical protein
VRIISCLLLFFMGAVPFRAKASALYAVDAGSADVWIINQSTGASSRVGLAGFNLESPSDMTSDTRAGSARLWAADDQDNRLVLVNPITGSATAVGTFNLPIGWKISAIAFDPITEKMYGTAYLSGSGIRQDTLYRIDPNSAQTTPIGAIHYALAPMAFRSLAFNNVGELYGVSIASASSDNRPLLSRIDTAAATVNRILPLNLPLVFDIAYRPEDGVLFAITQDESPVASNLYMLDPITGAATNIGSTGTNRRFTGAAFSAAVPDPTTMLFWAAITGLTRMKPSGRKSNVRMS